MSALTTTFTMKREGAHKAELEQLKTRWGLATDAALYRFLVRRAVLELAPETMPAQWPPTEDDNPDDASGAGRAAELPGRATWPNGGPATAELIEPDEEEEDDGEEEEDDGEEDFAAVIESIEAARTAAEAKETLEGFWPVLLAYCTPEVIEAAALRATAHAARVPTLARLTPGFVESATVAIVRQHWRTTKVQRE